MTPVNIFIDLSKAFDTLDHNILLNKLRYYGIKDTSLALFKSYLANRQQYVFVNDTKSDLLDVNTGVPQGSILGPLLFIIYINDLPKSTTKFNCIMYADDTTLSTTTQSFAQVNPTENVDHLINIELCNINSWLNVNKLSLNVKKAKYIVHKMPNKTVNHMQLYINGVEIEKVQHFNFLGLTLNEKMNWGNHEINISNKCSKTVGILNNLKHYLPSHIKLLLYNTLILPHINYCIL